MITTLQPGELANYVASQMSAFFPDRATSGIEIRKFVDHALERTDHNLSGQNRKYGREKSEAKFDHLHTDQYAVFLYYLSNSVHHLQGDRRLASKVYALNKALHGLDAFFEILLPPVFIVQHPVGTVLGRAEYGNFLFVYQQCLVGAGLDGGKPVLGDGVILFGGSSVIGNCRLGSNVWISAGSLLMDTDVPDNSIVFGRSPELTVRPAAQSVVRDVFRSSSEPAIL